MLLVVSAHPVGPGSELSGSRGLLPRVGASISLQMTARAS